ncbi:unnamed protein product [Chilo suppressalis]|uniref:UDP-glucuronosyltransferase n=1 Tax=Chilo suppressalis TaxID=168631 RepID=A0ABN8B2V0_CHISP|nr:unnamed protein product [Chilo suppressalis]
MAMPKISEILFLFLLVLVVKNEAARILAIYPTPSISHQVAFRPLTLELIKRGHEVVVITTDPIFRKGEGPTNLTEIDVHDASYNTWRKGLLESDLTHGSKNDMIPQMKVMFKLLLKIITVQLHHEEINNILKGNIKFDLLIHEAFYLSHLAFAHVLKVPVIQISSLGAVHDVTTIVGAPNHPLLYPDSIQQKIFNLSLWDKLNNLYMKYQMNSEAQRFERGMEDLVKKEFGPHVPAMSELKKKVDLVMLNVHSLWEMNRPTPPNMIYLGGLHLKTEKELPNDIKSYLDSSKNGVIYISFGTNVEPALLPPQKIQALINVFSKLPYDILWKWNRDELPGRSKNIKISKWLPQADLLRHPKVKLFITQGGLQSTDEAIVAGVPMIGFPMLGDQWYNVAQYVHHGIGLQMDMETLEEDKFRNAINEVVNNERYRRNIMHLRTIIQDQPQTSLERAVWWTEYVIRHRGARHLRSPAANITWAEYLELELVFYVLAACSAFLVALIFIVNKVSKMVRLSIKLKSS